MAYGNILRPLPDLKNKLYTPHFEGLKRNRILVQQCSNCERLQWPPRPFCQHCQNKMFHWKEMKQEGQIYTFSIVYRLPHPWFQNHTPFGIIVVDLGEGIRMMGNYFDDDVEKLECGMKVRANFEEINKKITILNWNKNK